MTSQKNLLILCTCGSIQEAEAVTTAVLEERLAACVNRITGIKSSYHWEGRVRQDDEVLLLIKTTTEAYAGLEAMIRTVHSYDNPEIIAVPITHGSAEYLAWLGAETA